MGWRGVRWEGRACHAESAVVGSCRSVRERDVRPRSRQKSQKRAVWLRGGGVGTSGPKGRPRPLAVGLTWGPLAGAGLHPRVRERPEHPAHQGNGVSGARWKHWVINWSPSGDPAAFSGTSVSWEPVPAAFSQTIRGGAAPP